MSQRDETKTSALGPQQPPEPPDYMPPRPPSLLLYAFLSAVALALLALALAKNTDWPGLLVNLSTEILGAILVLLLVERRIRASEVRFLRALPGTTRQTLSEWISPEVRQVKTYARVFAAQLDSVSRPYHVPLSEVESALEAHRAKGCVIVGHGGSGKSTQMHRLAGRQASEVLEQPRRARVPVLVPVLKWDEGDAADVLRRTMQSYSHVSDRTFRQLLNGERLMCMFDGLDESLRPREAAEGLNRFHAEHPSVPLIVSTRDAGEGFLEDLPRLKMWGLSEDEVERVLALRLRYADDVTH